MFYKFAPYILAVFGTILSLFGYYLDVIYRIENEDLLWIGGFFILFIGGFTTGKLIQELRLSSHTDFLTGLCNRRYFYLRLDEEEARMTKKRMQLCVAMIDMDSFKTINDIYDHAIGDVLLFDLATILKKNTKATDIVARWGGDEFAIIFCDTSLVEAYGVIERIRYKVENAFLPYNLTISAGLIALKPDQDLKNLLIKTDQALYKAKEQKNTIIAINE
jgi:diguanylate cyclase (GGDEF)-like protein